MSAPCATDHEAMGRVEPTSEQLAALDAREVVPHVQRVGGTVRYAGHRSTVVIGAGECPGWDAIFIVEYPSPQAFLDMVTDAGYLTVHEHRLAALDHGDLIATSTWTMAD
jgi:uncharacterized protein (DUF1330 family)